MTGDPKDPAFLKKSLKGVRAIICPTVGCSRFQLLFLLPLNLYDHLCRLNVVHVSLQEGFLSKVESLKGVQHVVILSQVLFISLS